MHLVPTPHAVRAALAQVPLPAWRQAQLGRECTQALIYLRSPRMPAGLAYALFTTVHGKPLAFPRLQQLARRLHADRGGRALELTEADVQFCDQARRVVEVHTQGLDGMRDRLIGYAWIDGAAKPRERLEAALDALQPRRVLRKAS